MSARIVVVGAGLAGLSCARRLHAAGLEVTVFEAEDDIGGRVRTDEVDGYRLDRGFQVLLTAYPECRAELDYEALELRTFFPGALIRVGGRFHRVADPWSQPWSAMRGVLAPIGSLTDKLKVARLRARLQRRSIANVFQGRDRPTRQALEDEGFSATMIDRFFRPFLGGIFLDTDLATSSRMFEFVFKMFGAGPGALPATGMQAIPKQLASALPHSAICTGTRVVARQPGGVVIEGGQTIQADGVVVATDATTAGRLAPALPERGWSSTVCLYYAAPEAPVTSPILVLNGEGHGPVNNLCVPSQVAPEYAPPGQSLVSVTVVGNPAEADLETRVRTQLVNWFGPVVESWRLLRTYAIEHALPTQPPATLEPAERPVRVEDGLYVCGDHMDNASIQGAMVSGRRAAEAVLDDLPSPMTL